MTWFANWRWNRRLDNFQNGAKNAIVRSFARSAADLARASNRSWLLLVFDRLDFRLLGILLGPRPEMLIELIAIVHLRVEGNVHGQILPQQSRKFSPKVKGD